MSLTHATIDLSRTRDRDQRTDGHLDNYIGHRAKIGVIIPSTNTSVEYDCQRLIPRGVSWHFSRFMIEHADLSDDDNFIRFLEMLRQTIGASIESLMTCKPDHVMMGMSAETFWGGIEGNDGFVEKIQEAVGDVGLTTGANAVIAALEALDVPGNVGKNIAVITPYQPIGDKNVHLFFEDSGYNVKQVLGLRCENAHDAIALVPDHQVMDMVRQVDADDIDAIIQVGTNLSTATSFPVIEKWLEKPVLPINVATAWHALRSCGVRDQYDHLGRLFEEH
ncbi:Asp/Glu/Hydantoin racemase superfamily protein [marine gamma proteobacterium HTCC2148]|jgi:maleate isomerase|nr:Asp/Glu/Hydantoin racemase superfamily protein [marine gamma proteobacterium HTCC2148]MBT5006228.1 Asp/Glu racemase [Halieaceae bacterium]